MIAILIVLLVCLSFAGLVTLLTDAPFWYLVAYQAVIGTALCVYQYAQYRHLHKSIAEFYSSLLRS